MAYTSV